MIRYWLKMNNRTWHAWPSGGRSSMCGRINVEHLRQRPASDLRSQAPLDEHLCRSCARKSGVYAVSTHQHDARVAAWAGFINRHLWNAHVMASRSAVTDLATRLAEIGTPAEPEALQVYEQIRALLLTPRGALVRNADGQASTRLTLPGLKKALAALPEQHGVLMQIASTLRTWRLITGRDTITDHCKADQVIQTILQIPEPEQYIKHLHNKGFSHLAGVFHPNTLERAKKDTALRGLFSGTTDYWNDTFAQRRIISE